MKPRSGEAPEAVHALRSQVRARMLHAVTEEQRATLEALGDQPPTEDVDTLRALWHRLLDAFSGTPPRETFHVVGLLFLVDEPPDLEAERRAWSDRTGIALREPQGELLR